MPPPPLREGGLRVVALGALVAFAPLLVAERWTALLAVMCVYACFASSITPLVDSLTLEYVAREGGSYARIRDQGQKLRNIIVVHRMHRSEMRTSHPPLETEAFGFGRQLFDMPRQGRLGEAEGARGGGEAPLANDGQVDALLQVSPSWKAVNYESVIAVSRYDKGQLVEIRLYPTDGRFDGPVSTLGIPRSSPRCA